VRWNHAVIADDACGNSVRAAWGATRRGGALGESAQRNAWHACIDPEPRRGIVLRFEGVLASQRFGALPPVSALQAEGAQLGSRPRAALWRLSPPALALGY
jgi:hypothetical protein